MRKKCHYRGFSLTEVLLAVGTLAVGMIFISGTFLTGIHFSTIATERTYAAVVADEAFAKVKIYGSADPDWLSGKSTFACFDFFDVNDVNNIPLITDLNEFAYPSTITTITSTPKQYYWSALCRPVNSGSDNQLTQVTVFVSRKIGANTQYRNPADPFNPLNTFPYPRLVSVSVSGALGSDVLTLQDVSFQTFINDGYTIIKNETGQIFRVLNRNADQPNTIQLDRPLPFETTNDIGIPWSGLFWVIPPPIGGGRYPCIGIYQKLIRF